MDGHGINLHKIPNGKNIPNPCSGKTGKWYGVGHVTVGGGTTLTAFGEAFEANSHNWTSVCNLDSDGDGKSNGVELGDPNCKWAVGNGASLGAVTGHPGICEPMTDATCTEKNKDINCNC